MNFVHVHAEIVVAVPASAIARWISYGVVRWNGSAYVTQAPAVALLATHGAFIPNR